MNGFLPFVHELVPAPDPARICEQLEALPYRLFFDSATQASPLSRYSFLVADPFLVIRSRYPLTEIVDANGPRAVPDDALELIRQRLASFRTAPVSGLPPFQGGAAGYIAYDWGRQAEQIPDSPHDDLGMPDLVLGLYDWVIAWDHFVHRTWLISTGLSDKAAGPDESHARRRAADVLATIGGEPADDSPLLPGTVMPIARDNRPPAYEQFDLARGLYSSFTQTGYIDAVRRVREYILAGDIFQANLSQRFQAPLHESPWSFYSRLRTRNPAPFAAFLDFPETVIASASPERFLRVDPGGRVETRPIKGTRPRGIGPEHDAHLGQALSESEKDRAENLMIVDLMRNDLSRVCAPGSVRAPELFALERYATVHHLVSTVVGQLRPGNDPATLLRASFPGGSVTGAPKIRAMQIIAELEPTARGVYCGSIGYWSVTGAFDTNIAIRTGVIDGGRIFFSAGGGIVADSEPAQEYRETLDKARGMIDALASTHGVSAR